MMRLISLLLFIISVSFIHLPAQSFDAQRSVQVVASVSDSPAGIRLRWDNSIMGEEMLLYRKSPGQTSWNAIAELSPADSVYMDADIERGVRYEYRLLRATIGINGYGYVLSGIEIPPVDSRGILLLVIDSSLTDSLSTEINRLKADLLADAWTVKTIVVSPNDAVPEVKDTITKRYLEAPNRTKSLFLLGHIPVPYSGNINPDGHGNHQGAWPADVYYGDMDGTWTDVSVDNTSAASSRNHNVPGDGKYDQSVLPSSAELEIGRVDFHNLPQFNETEIELTRRYLDKNHAWRTGQLQVRKRGLIENNFGGFEEGFGQNGLKNFAPLVGMDSTFYMDYDRLKSESYLWSYGCGAGNYQGAAGITSTSKLANDSLQTVFTMLFGSYFGDWDSQDNVLRAALASGTVLSNAWAGRPNWAFHPMGLGATLGYCTKISQNNLGQYVPGFGQRFIHVALMGDPSLRMHPIAPPSGLEVTEVEGHALLEWISSIDSVMGYHIYRKKSEDRTYSRITDTFLQQTFYMDSCLEYQEDYAYYVKAIELKTGPSGSYYNLSQGVADSLRIQTDLSVSAGFEFSGDEGVFSFTNTSDNAASYFWNFGDGQTDTTTHPTHQFDQGTYQVQLIAKNACFTDTFSREIEVILGSVQKLDQNDISIYPNPVSESQLTIEAKQSLGRSTIQLFNIKGELIQSIKCILNGRHEIDVGYLLPGLYLLEVETENQSMRRKIVIY